MVTKPEKLAQLCNAVIKAESKILYAKKQLGKAEDAYTKAVSVRDKTIKILAAEGFSYAKIARFCTLSRQRISQIIKGKSN